MTKWYAMIMSELACSNGFDVWGKSMKCLVRVLCLLCCLCTGAAWADAKLASDKNCLACHDLAAKRMGPSFKEIATRYAGQKEAQDKLTLKVLKGGSGNWGNAPMPSNPQVNEAEARKLSVWILGQK